MAARAGEPQPRRVRQHAAIGEVLGSVHLGPRNTSHRSTSRRRKRRLGRGAARKQRPGGVVDSDATLLRLPCSAGGLASEGLSRLAASGRPPREGGCIDPSRERCSRKRPWRTMAKLAFTPRRREDRALEVVLARRRISCRSRQAVAGLREAPAASPSPEGRTVGVAGGLACRSHAWSQKRCAWGWKRKGTAS